MNIYLKRAIIILKVFAAITLLFVLRPLEWLIRAVIRGFKGFVREFGKWEESPLPNKEEWSAVIEQAKEDWKG